MDNANKKAVSKLLRLGSRLEAVFLDDEAAINSSWEKIKAALNDHDKKEIERLTKPLVGRAIAEADRMETERKKSKALPSAKRKKEAHK